ncbi:MAG TPA: hypothetical protein VF384_15850 [Planctomycetota bacterium]
MVHLHNARRVGGLHAFMVAAVMAVDSSTLADSIIAAGDNPAGSITVNGILAQIQGTTWSVQVPLVAGANELVLRRNGSEVARSQLENALPLLDVTGAVSSRSTSGPALRRRSARRRSAAARC